MKKFSEIFDINEISSRVLSKYIKIATPDAQGKGVVGTLKKDSKLLDKADDRLKKILKAKSKLDDLIHYNKPVTEEIISETLKDDLNNLTVHLHNDNRSSTDVSQMHKLIYDISKKHNVSGDSLYRQIASEPNIHQSFKDAASLDD